MEIMACVVCNSFRKKEGRTSWEKRRKKNKRKERDTMSVITPNTFVFDVAAVIFPPLDVVREHFQDHSDIGRVGLGGGGGGGGGNIESMLPPASEYRVIV